MTAGGSLLGIARLMLERLPGVDRALFSIQDQPWGCRIEIDLCCFISTLSPQEQQDVAVKIQSIQARLEQELGHPVVIRQNEMIYA